MKLGDPLLKILNKVYPPLEMIDMPFKRYDLRFKTNEDGWPVLLFIGKRTDKNTIKGERFARTLQIDNEGRILKDHWDNKGKVS
jgi:hypothetical protein